MAKTTKKEKLDELAEAVASCKPFEAITVVTADFGREDINLLRDKVNEVVEAVNSALATGEVCSAD